MESQAEMTNKQRAEIEEIAAGVDAKPDLKKDKKPKGKGEKEISKEEIQAAVAGVVLAEMKLWPEAVVALVGEQHPNKNSFFKGVVYVVGGYMHLARKGLHELVKRRKKDAEQKTCGLLSPVSKELTALRGAFEKARDCALSDLEGRRREKLNRAKRIINQRFEKRISEVKARKLPDRAVELIVREATIKSAFVGACRTIDVEAKELETQIKEIEEARDDWSSKKRRAKRLADDRTKEDAQQVQEAVE